MSRLWFGVVVVMLSGVTRASGPPQPLDFPSKKYTVTYRTCGCADFCWVAEVAAKKAPKTLLFKLRCDCEQLLFEDLKAKTSVAQPETCAAAQDKKFELIPARLEVLLPK